MKNLLILLLFVSVISYCAVDFTAPVINLSNKKSVQAALKSISTNGSFRIMVDVDDDEATCLWEQTSGPNVFLNGNSKPFSRISEPVSWDLCNLVWLKANEPGERIFHLTVTDKRGRSSTMTIPITVAQGASLKVCSNGTKEMESDDYGHFCCMEEMRQEWPQEWPEGDLQVLHVKLDCPPYF